MLRFGLRFGQHTVFNGKLDEGNHLEDAFGGGRIALKWMFRVACVLAGFSRLRTQTIIVLL